MAYFGAVPGVGTQLDRIAAVCFRLLRGVRTVGLWLVGPLDAALRGSRLPPLWLRRHAGKITAFETSATQTAELIREGKHVALDDLVLDLGCGPGAMTPWLVSMLGPRGRYLGIDVHAPSIRSCRRRFDGDPRLEFLLADLRTPYSAHGAGIPSTYRLPLADGSVGFALAKSLFTHLLPAEAQRYLTELGRVLMPGRHVFLTAFLYGPGVVPAFPYSDASNGMRWRRRGRRQAGIAYEKTGFLRMVSAAGLRVSALCEVFYPGSIRHLKGQDILVLERE